MLRLLAALLLAANGLFFVWSQGWLDDYTGLPARGEREPHRLSNQVRPEAVKVLTPRAASAAMAAAAAASSTVCLEAGPFADADLPAAEQGLAALPPGSWARVATQRSGRWLVYMGRFADREMLERKIDEVKRRQLPFEEVRGVPGLEPGLSLGGYDSRGAAQAALDGLLERGVRTARIVALTTPGPATLLRVERADPALRAQLSASGLAFTACGPRS